MKYDSNLVNEDLKDIITGIIQNDKYYCIKAALSDLDLIITKAIHALQECKTLHLKR